MVSVWPLVRRLLRTWSIVYFCWWWRRGWCRHRIILHNIRIVVIGMILCHIPIGNGKGVHGIRRVLHSRTWWIHARISHAAIRWRWIHVIGHLLIGRRVTLGVKGRCAWGWWGSTERLGRHSGCSTIVVLSAVRRRILSF